MIVAWVFGLSIGVLMGWGIAMYVAGAWEKGRLAEQAREREEWVVERRDLNNRIQVPEAAPFMAVGSEKPPLQHVPYDDDDAFNKATEELGIEWQ